MKLKLIEVQVINLPEERNPNTTCLAQGNSGGTQSFLEAAASWSVLLFAPDSAPGAPGQLWHTLPLTHSRGRKEQWWRGEGW